MEDIFTRENPSNEPGSIPADRNASVEYAVNLLDEKIATVLFERYKQGMTFDAIGKLHGVSRERARQIIEKGLRKLRHPSVYRYVRYSVSGVLRMEKIEAADTARKRASEQNIKKILGDCVEKGVTVVEQMDLLDTPVQQLNLSMLPFIDALLSDSSFLRDIEWRIHRLVCLKAECFGCGEFEDVGDKDLADGIAFAISRAFLDKVDGYVESASKN